MKIKHKEIPGFFEWMLRVYTHEEDLIHLNGDYLEIYNEIYQRGGRISAVLWLIKQILKSAFIFFSDTIYGSIIMFRNYLIIAIRNIKNKIYSIINISGLSIGIACFLAIYLYVNFEMSYDNYHEDAER
ncbi:hypothetical protein ACFL6G_10075, partial [candidate division KSB1 bacterium]